MDIENSNIIVLKNENGERSCFTFPNIQTTMARVLTVLLVVNCLSLNQYLRACFELKFGFILVVYCGGTVPYLLAKDVSAFLWGLSSIRNQTQISDCGLCILFQNPYTQKRRCLSSELAVLLLKYDLNIDAIITCLLPVRTDLTCLLITRWWVDAGLCFPDTAAFSWPCAGDKFWITQQELFISLYYRSTSNTSLFLIQKSCFLGHYFSLQII